MKTQSIKNTIIGYFIAIMAVVIFLIVVVNVIRSQQKLFQGQESKAEITSANIALACADPMMVGEWDKIASILEGVKTSDEDAVYASLIGTDGRCVASSEPELKDKYLNKSDFEKEVLEVKGLKIFSRADLKNTFEIAAPVISGGSKTGVLRIGYTTKNIKSIINNTMYLSIFIAIIALLGGSFIYYLVIKRRIIDPLNQVIVVAENISDGVLSQKEIEIKSNDEIGQLGISFNKMLNGLGELVKRAMLIANGNLGASIVDEKIQKGVSISLAAAVDDGGMKGDLALAFNKMQEELRKLTIQARRIASDELNDNILDVKISGELGDAFSQMSSNLKQLAGIAEKIANNDLTANVSVASDKAVLANVFYKMVFNLKNLIGIVVELTDSAHNSANGMADATKQVSQMMTQIQDSMQQIASATNQVAKNTQEISSLVGDANKVIETGNENVNMVLDKFVVVQSTIEGTGESINKLEQRSKEISEIVGLITKIADQTNLLALNAAIEAARAGEAGRGFAVVADEVRKLAESSGMSAERISNIIKEIQQDMSGVVLSSKNSLEESKIVFELTKNMQRGYSDIVQAIKAVSHQVEQIAAISEETAASTEEITGGSEEQVAALTEIANSSKALVEQVNKLKGEVNKFRI